MKLDLNKHITRKRDEKWNTLSEEEKKIAGLKNSLEEVKKEILKLSKALKGRGGKGNHRSKDNNEQKNPKKGSRNTGNEDQCTWKKVPPLEGKSN